MTSSGTRSHFSEADLDALRELANIGAGAAATRLYESTHALVRTRVPRSTVLVLPDELDAFGEPEREVTAVVCRAGGEMQMLLALLLSPRSAEQLGAELVNRAPADDARPGDAASSPPLLQVGRRMCLAFVDAVAQVTGQKISLGDATVLTDMRAAVLQSAIALVGDSADTVVIVDTQLEAEPSRLGMSFLFLPESERLEALLTGMGMKRQHPPERA